jgi:hypothetical protein
MIRIVLENVLLFLLPAFAYFTYKLAMSRGTTTATQVFNDAPLVVLLVAGGVLMFGTLIMFATTTDGGKPGQAYEPGVLKDGRVQPGRMR